MTQHSDLWEDSRLQYLITRNYALGNVVRVAPKPVYLITDVHI